MIPKNRTQSHPGQILLEEFLEPMGLVFGARFETTASQIGNGLLGRLRHPDAMARLRSEPELLKTLPDELLRYDGTAQMTVRVVELEMVFGALFHRFAALELAAPARFRDRITLRGLERLEVTCRPALHHQDDQRRSGH
jgi:cytochrome P450